MKGIIAGNFDVIHPEYIEMFNEIYQICKKVNADYDKLIEATIEDDKLGTSHWKVPGPDGDFGYGGHCFPRHQCTY